jgi:hypothetical protein
VAAIAIACGGGGGGHSGGSGDEGENWGDPWSAPAALNTNAGTDSEDDLFPQVTTDGAGNWVAVWESDDTLGGTIGTDLDILVARH